MKNRFSILTIGWLIALCGSCVSFKVGSSTPGEHILEKIEFCPSVEESPDVMRSVGPKDEFGQDDRQICCLIKVRVVSKSLTLRWRWYSPEKELWRDTGEVQVNTEGKSIDAVSAYDLISRDTDELAKGAWTVAVFINGHLAGRRAFKII